MRCREFRCVVEVEEEDAALDGSTCSSTARECGDGVVDLVVSIGGHRFLDRHSTTPEGRGGVLDLVVLIGGHRFLDCQIMAYSEVEL